MSNPIIQVEGIGKSYKISHELKASVGNVSIRDGINNIVRKPIELVTGHRMRQEKFWALKDINFEVEQGEVLGIIGKNGSGKSTLLKIMSRITEPTTGEIRMHGRVASLLEVGTGFHPELTGRENIYFNGSILGMRKKEIESKFDEIVAFSEVEKFLDTPVKFYSSGMYVRLAFAVAAHLDPDILIIDEVLAVGDAAFQKKCLGKMQDVASQGRTVLFVSHNLNSVQGLCKSVVVIEDGKLIIHSNDVRTAVDKYLHNQGVLNGSYEWNNKVDFVNNYFQPKKLFLTDNNSNKITAPITNNDQITLHIEGVIKKTDPLFNIGIAVYSEEGDLLFWSFTTDSKEKDWPILNPGEVNLTVNLPTSLLNEGNYRIELLASLNNKEWILKSGESSPTIIFKVRGGFNISPYWQNARPGILAPKLNWMIK